MIPGEAKHALHPMALEVGGAHGKGGGKPLLQGSERWRGDDPEVAVPTAPAVACEDLTLDVSGDARRGLRPLVHLLERTVTPGPLESASDRPQLGRSHVVAGTKNHQ